METSTEPRQEKKNPPGDFVSVNPLKMSAPLGGALFFLGLDRSLPVFHGSQGCTSFALVLLGRHFKESIPLQTTAMSEVTTILGGGENIQAAILKILEKGTPGVIGLCSTGLTETKGEDIVGEIALFRKKHPEHAGIPVIAVSTPDFRGSHEDGFRDAMVRTIEDLAEPGQATVGRQINVLAGSHLTVADLDYLREILESFGLDPIFLPDLSRSLDGIVPESFEPVSMGGDDSPGDPPDGGLGPHDRPGRIPPESGGGASRKMRSSLRGRPPSHGNGRLRPLSRNATASFGEGLSTAAQSGEKSPFGCHARRPLLRGRTSDRRGARTGPPV